MVIILLLIDCLLFLPLCAGALYCHVVLNFLSSFAIILLRKRELVVLLWLFYCCRVDAFFSVFSEVPWAVIVAVLSHAHLNFL